MTHHLKIKLLAICLLVSLCATAQKTYVVAVGLNNYDNGQNPLPCSRNDAQGLASFFNNYNGGDVFVLLDKNATRDHIMRVLKSHFSKSTPDDEIIFAYSGHGFDGGITSYESDKVIFCSEIQEILRNANARRKIMFVNSCHSGSFSKKYGNDSRSRDYKSKNSNVMLYMSSRADEVSWESTAMRYSFFFSRLIRGLKGEADKNGDNKVTARELFNYVNAGVIADTNGDQHPQMYGKFSDDMVVVYTK